jgi:hypothetical protein
MRAISKLAAWAALMARLRSVCRNLEALRPMKSIASFSVLSNLGADNRFCHAK